MIAAAPFIAIFISSALLLSGNGLAFVLVPIFGDAQGFTDLSIGMIGAAYFGGFVSGCIAVPHLIIRAGHIRTYAALTSSAAVMILLLPQLVIPAFWILLRFLAGFCMAGIYTTIESWLNEQAESSVRGRVLSIYTVISLSVVSIGTLLINTGDATQGLFLFTLAAILYCLSVVPISMTKTSAPMMAHEGSIGFAKLLAMTPVGVLGCVVTGLANGAFWALGPLYTQAGGLSVAQTTYFIAVAVIGGAVFQWPLGSISDRLDRRIVIALGSFGAGLAGIALSFLPDEAGAFAFLFGGAVYGSLALPLYAVAVAHVNDYLKPGEFVNAGGTLVLLFGAGAAIGPLIASTLIAVTTEQTLFAYTAIIHLAFAALIVVRLRIQAPVPEETKSAFVPFAAATPVAIDLDPRSSVEDEV